MRTVRNLGGRPALEQGPLATPGAAGARGVGRRERGAERC